MGMKPENNRVKVPSDVFLINVTIPNTNGITRIGSISYLVNIDIVKKAVASTMLASLGFIIKYSDANPIDIAKISS